MKEMSLQSVAYNVINSLIRSGEFSDRLELVKTLLSLLYLYDQTPSDFEEILRGHNIYSLREFFHANLNLRKVNAYLTYEDSGLKLLLGAIENLLPSFKTDKREVVNSILSTLTMAILGKHQGLDTEPNEIASLIAFVAKHIGIESVFDPFAGIASFATTPEFEGISFEGAELSIVVADIANLRLALNGQPMTVERMDSLRNWNQISFTDALVAVPPYGMSLKDYDFYMSSSKKRSEDFILDEIIERSDIRKAVVLLPLHRFATSYENEASRKYLVETGQLEMVISLPSASLFGTNIPTAIIVINKDRLEEDGETVTFISLLDCITPDSRVKTKLDLLKAKRLISSQEGKYTAKVNWSEIIEHHNSELNPGEYLLNNILPTQKDDLRYFLPSWSILEKDASIPSLGNKQTVIGLKDLEDEYSFSKEGVLPTTIVSSRYYEISEPTILVGLSSSRLKVGIAYPIEGPLYVSAEIASLKIDDFWINPEFLMLELTKSYVQEQIRLLGYDRSYGKIETVLRKIKIVNPSKDSQKESVNKAKDSILAKYQHVISSFKRDFRQDVHMKRHAMGQTIQTVGNWWKVLEAVRSKGELINEKALVGGGELSLGEVLDNIRSNIARIKVQIDRLDRGYKAMPVRIDLIDFIETYKSTHRSPVFHYSNLDYEEALDDDGRSKVQSDILFPPEVLTMILNNIVSNASSHGFGNIATATNLIKFAIDNVGDSYVVSVANNGKPCPPDMTPEQMIKYGESSDLKHHCGIGGYEINQLMTDFGGSLDILLDAGAEFPVEYRLTFKSFEK